MNHRLSHHAAFVAAATAVIAALALGACNQPGEPTPGQRVDSAIAKVEREADKLKADASEASLKVRQAAAEAAHDAKQGAAELAEKVKLAGVDAAIVVSVNVELARDAKLDPAQIDVESSRGRVALRGTAPDAESVLRARQIVLAVKGVTGVDNFLTVRKS